MPESPDTQTLVDHLFRHESGKMISILTRLFGLHQLELAEDVVQEAFLKAAQTWTYESIPSNPSAWLMAVAKNKAIDLVRHTQRANQYSRELASQLQESAVSAVEEFFHQQEIADSQLQMIFACCHPALRVDDQIAFTLKTVSGFGVAEIAKSLMTNVPVVQKRLYRAREMLRAEQIQLEIPAAGELLRRLNTVHTVIYLLFNEGYNSIKTDELIRKDLCVEAMRLAKLLTEHPCGRKPNTYALLSLMCFQASRFESRMDADQSIVLLQSQDRNKWDKDLIAMGYRFLSDSSFGDEISIYHLESAIAAEHCLAPSFDATNWERLLSLYNMLYQKKQSPVVALNRAVVLAQMGQLQQAIDDILSISGIDDLINAQYIYGAVLGDLYLRCEQPEMAAELLRKAYTLTTSQAEKKLIAQKLSAVQSTN